MRYTNFGSTGIKISKLGFGGMRFPMREINEKKVIDEDLAVPLLHRAFELGVNYVDSAPYYCESQSEAVIGKALKSYGGRIYVSTKNPVEDADGGNWTGRLEKSLKNLGIEKIDFYHLWGIGYENIKSWTGLEYGPLEAAVKAREQGLIGNLSFSTHDSAENIIKVIDSGYFESVTLQYNLMDRANAPAIAHARKKGLGVVVMGPVGGGRLGEPSEVILNLLAKKPVSTAELALRFVTSNEGVDVALSGMSDMKQVEENAEIVSREGSLTPEELNRIDEMMEENKKLAGLYCTGCDYCMPCPKEINIPMLFGIMNNHRVYGLTNHARNEYRDVVNGWSWVKSADASKCAECGECEAKCPQKLPIISQLKETHTALA